MDHDYKAAAIWAKDCLDGARFYKEISSALEIARKLQEGFVMVPVNLTPKMVAAALPDYEPAKGQGHALMDQWSVLITAAQETRKG